MKIIKYPNPDIQDEELTTLSVDIDASDTTLPVLDSADFAVDDYIVIEAVGNDRCEMKQVSAVPDEENLTIIAVLFSHGKLTPVRKTQFNQMRLYRSADDVTYNLIDTKDVDWQDPKNQAVFVDDTGSDDYYYKVEYYNSTRDVGLMSVSIKTETKIGYITVEDFKNITGIKGDDNIIADGLRYGASKIKNMIYTLKMFASASQDTDHIIYTDGLEFADGNLDAQIDKDDFIVWEEDPDGTRTYVSDITNVDVDRYRISFATSRPAGGKNLVMEFYVTTRKLDVMIDMLKRLSTLYGVNWIFQNIPFKKLQRGIGGWTINNVTIDFESDMVKQTVKDNETTIKELIREIQGMIARRTNIYPPRKTPSYIKSTLRSPYRSPWYRYRY